MSAEKKPSFFRSLVNRAAGVVAKTAVVATLGPQLGVVAITAAKYGKDRLQALRESIDRLRKDPPGPGGPPPLPATCA
jgi:hypothetical protein